MKVVLENERLIPRNRIVRDEHRPWGRNLDWWAGQDAEKQTTSGGRSRQDQRRLGWTGSARVPEKDCVNFYNPVDSDECTNTVDKHWFGQYNEINLNALLIRLENENFTTENFIQINKNVDLTRTCVYFHIHHT